VFISSIFANNKFNQKQYYGKHRKLSDLATLLTKDVSTIEKSKNERRKELEERTMTVVRIMQVFAHDKKKGKLQRKLYHLTYEFIENCMDLELVEISKEIWLIANKFG